MRIKKIIKEKRLVLESIFSLSILNGLNVLLPLITLPYITRIVGVEYYGIYSYIYVLIQYVLLINSYGFTFSATKQISENRNNLTALKTIYNAVIVCRLLLAVIAVFIFLALSPLIMETRSEKIMFLMGLSIVIGDSFIPTWLFQGLEKMRFITIVNVISKLLFTLLIFIVIRKADDYFYIILFNGLGYIAAGICSSIIVYKQFKIGFCRVSFKDLMFQMKDGLALFGSNISMNLYRNSNIFILKFFVSDAAVGIYSAAEKVIKGLQSIVSPISQALFPHFSFQFKQSAPLNNIKSLIKISKYFAPLVLVFTIATFFCATVLINLLCGKDFLDAAPLIRIMSLVIFIGSMNHLLGIVGLVNLNGQKQFFIAVMISGIISILFLLISVKSLDIFAAAWAMVISELILFFFCIRYLWKLRHSKFKNV